jgi:hypothetical protein
MTTLARLLLIRPEGNADPAAANEDDLLVAESVEADSS